MKMKKIALGIDIGGTNTVFGFITKKGKIISQNSIPTKGYGNFKKYKTLLFSEIDKLISELPSKYKIKGIGIGAPNGNFYSGNIEFAPNLDWGETVPIAKVFQEQYKLPVWLTNDANAAAIGEMVYGGAKNMKDFLFVTLGTGLGSGIVSNGKLIYGHDGFAGEMGHITAIPDGRKCACGRKGCLETYVSATGIVRTVKEYLEDSTNASLLREINLTKLNSKHIYDAAKKGDELALKAFEFTSDILGKSLADMVALFSPKTIFLFGGLANAKELIIDSTKKQMEDNLMKIYKNKVSIKLSELENNSAAIVGASALVWDSL